MSAPCKRGEMFYADLSPYIGSEQGGRRPVIVIQNDTGNQHSPTVIIAAVTSKTMKARLPVHVRLPSEIGLEKDSIALLEQIRTIDKSRLESYIGRLDEATMSRIDRALGISVGIDTPGHYIKRADKAQTIKDTCTYCNVRQGYDYIVVDR